MKCKKGSSESAEAWDAATFELQSPGQRDPVSLAFESLKYRGSSNMLGHPAIHLVVMQQTNVTEATGLGRVANFSLSVATANIEKVHKYANQTDTQV